MADDIAQKSRKEEIDKALAEAHYDLQRVASRIMEAGKFAEHMRPLIYMNSLSMSLMDLGVEGNRAIKFHTDTLNRIKSLLVVAGIIDRKAEWIH